jgi:hypothetical protein
MRLSQPSYWLPWQCSFLNWEAVPVRVDSGEQGPHGAGLFPMSSLLLQRYRVNTA